MSNSLKLSVPEGVPFIDYEREFDFPVADVFRAHKEPDLIVQWLGPRGMKMEMDHYDFRTGGSYRFGGYPDVVSLDFMTFEDLGNGRTRLRGHSVYPSQAARDGMAQSGMEGGLSEGYERLEELLAGARV